MSFTSTRSIVSTCCNKELADSCLFNCDKQYCTNSDVITYNPLDGLCSGYINSEALRNILKGMEASDGNNTCV
jgi:hypothetical protein